MSFGKIPHFLSTSVYNQKTIEFQLKVVIPCFCLCLRLRVRIRVRDQRQFIVCQLAGLLGLLHTHRRSTRLPLRVDQSLSQRQGHGQRQRQPTAS